MFESFLKYFDKAAINRGMTTQLTAAQICNVARKEIAKHFTKLQDSENNISVVSFKSGTIFVTTSSPLWSQQINLRKSAIVKDINLKVGKNEVKTIRFYSSLA